MIDLTRFTLDNGLRVVHHHDNTTPLVAVNILYDVGAKDEEEDKTGFAHLFEHLMFGGSINIPNFDTPLQNVGGQNNAFTNNDITNYYVTVPANNVETVFWLESDRMLSLAFSENSLEVQRKVVIEEFKQRYLNQPYGDFWLKFRPVAFKKHPYRWATIGKEISHIEDATLEDVKAFFKKYYAPLNAILVVAGNISLEETKRLCEKWFEPIDSGIKYERSLPVEPEQTEQRKITVEGKVPYDKIFMAWHMKGKNHPDFYTYDLITDILANGNSSRLYQKLVKEKQLFTNIGSYHIGSIDPGLLMVAGDLNDGVTFETAETEIWNALNKLQNELVEDRELEKVKNKIESSHNFSEMSVLNKAMSLAQYELLENANNVNQEVSQYLKVTPEQIKSLSEKIFRKEKSNILYYKATA